MKLLICLVTYNRLAYTKRTLRELFKTIEVPYYLVIVDNASTDGTDEYLLRLLRRNRCDEVIINNENLYPGKATNIGWTESLKKYPEATHLVRLDNDMAFEKGWDIKAEKMFNDLRLLGQLGLDYDANAGKDQIKINGITIGRFPDSIGGPCIIKRQIFDGGMRFPIDKWENSFKQVQEDSIFSQAIRQLGYMVGYMDERLSYTFADETNWSDYPEYYLKTMTDRNYQDSVMIIKKLLEK